MDLKKRKSKNIVIGLILFCFVIILYFYNPVHTFFYPKCIFYETTGYFCPGCGTLRSFHSLFHGNFTEAFFSNVLIYILSFYFMLKLFFSKMKCGKFFLKFSSLEISVLMIIIMIYWVIRNINFYPFTILAP